MTMPTEYEINEWPSDRAFSRLELTKIIISFYFMEMFVKMSFFC